MSEFHGQPLPSIVDASPLHETARVMAGFALGIKGDHNSLGFNVPNIRIVPVNYGPSPKRRGNLFSLVEDYSRASIVWILQTLDRYGFRGYCRKRIG
jgi:hypothetical protein